MTRPDNQLNRAVELVRREINLGPKTGLILGSGLSGLADLVERPVHIEYDRLPGLAPSAVEGHPGRIIAGTLAGTEVLVFAGRAHYYEGHSMTRTTAPVRLMAALGLENLIITNAAGGINLDFRPGDVMVIDDHINLMGDNPLRGGPNFIDLTTAYDAGLRSMAHEAAGEAGLKLRSGVYAAVSGPCYETPAEVRMLRILGGDAVGMSTAPEAIEAAAQGLRTLGLSIITNMAAGVTGRPLSHREVIETSDRASQKLQSVVLGVLKRLKGRC